MKDKRFRRWYDLPKEFRDRIYRISDDFEYLREQGEWAIGPAGHEPEAFAVLRRGGTLYYDSTMPALRRIMEKGIRVAIFPVGMKMVDIVFLDTSENQRGEKR
jgi:hypothetical protein